MLKISYGGDVSEGRRRVVDRLQQARSENPSYRCIDLGAVAGQGWSSSVVDLVVDINSSDTDSSMKLDICRWDSWSRLLALVEEQGKFDYAICTHTLEDIYNPFTALELLPKIAQAGYISMPSVNTELSYCDKDWCMGYIHHRWIFNQEDGEMLVMPKLGYLEHDFSVRRAFNWSIYEIRYEWEGALPFRVFKDNFLGPSSEILRRDLNSALNRSPRGLWVSPAEKFSSQPASRWGLPG